MVNMADVNLLKQNSLKNILRLWHRRVLCPIAH